ANGSRNGDVVVVEEGALVFHIETSAGHARVRQPGEGDVVEDVVPREIAVRLPIDKQFHDVRVAGHVVVDHPGGKGDGRVRQPVQGLRVCGHHHLRRDVLVKECHLVVCLLLLSRETRRRGRPGRRGPGTGGG